ncbi:DUF58 domain-containing protein [Actimicrobium sp. CCI2.3]|uniref:DUF58 domain-containing protein n=1 Tax=Actimicrobium sp. CCI2.3 TaxID=3048616 RepID=UPI002AB35DD9|nr:DUF58 domain-containing protein [Actimicrobium sp. CCI2.3]MDY7575928.1 DUF58 domain-containing protein [Actimicrobium sp. CCI2.3]MEB0023196.1 DUF58 domain-containing protein [Actimicrobium sp. CCI2.3]
MTIERTRIGTLIDRWLYRLAGPETGEIVLSQRRVFIVPSGAGWGFATMLVLLFTGSVNYNLNLGFAFTFLIASCAVVDMHLTFRNLAYLHLAPGRAPAIFCGDMASFELQLINRRKHDRYAIWMDFYGHAGAVAQAVDVAALGTSKITLGVASVTRGWLPAPRVRLVTRFPLGLLRAWSYWQPDMRVLVYPHPEQGAPPLPLVANHAAHGIGMAGSDDFAGIRAYRPGDPMQQLAWRQIARIDPALGGMLLTKQFEGGAVSELVIDFAAFPRVMDLELKLSRMTRWVLDAEASRLPYAFRLGALNLPSAHGPAQQAACLQALAEFAPA